MLDDFERPQVERWLSKPNVELAQLHVGGNGILRARMDFSEFDYGWLRKSWHDNPLDGSDYHGVRFRIRARGVGRLIVHVMTGQDDQHLTTYEIAKPLSLRAQGWHTFMLSWLEFGTSEDGKPLDDEALCRIRYINVSAVGQPSRSGTVDLDDLALVRLPAVTLECLRSRTPAGWAEEAEREFFGGLDYDPRRFPGIEGIQHVLPADQDAPAQAYAPAKAQLLAYVRGRARPVYSLTKAERARVFDAIAKEWPDLPDRSQR